MDFVTFVRKPFKIEATEITKENIEEVAEFVGVLKEKSDGSPYIQVNRRLVPNIYGDRVYPGYWMTKMGDEVRCYSKSVFKKQFIENSEEIETWIEYLNGRDHQEVETDV